MIERSSPLVLATALPEAGGATAMCAAVAVSVARESGSAPVLAIAGDAAPRPTLLASRSARERERDLRAAGIGAAARGTFCEARLAVSESTGPAALCGAVPEAPAVIVLLEPDAWREALEAAEPAPAAAVIRANRAQRAQAALLAIELRARSITAAVVLDAPGVVASRRARAGIDPGGPLSRRAARITARGLPWTCR